jgi:hypothetical protein
MEKRNGIIKRMPVLVMPKVFIFRPQPGDWRWQMPTHLFHGTSFEENENGTQLAQIESACLKKVAAVHTDLIKIRSSVMVSHGWLGRRLAKTLSVVPDNTPRFTQANKAAVAQTHKAAVAQTDKAAERHLH